VRREAQFADGYVQWLFEWDWPRAESAFKRAITLDPSHVTAYRTLGHVLSQMGAHRQAEQTMAHTRGLEPLSPMRAEVTRTMVRFPLASECANGGSTMEVGS
jgi:hypothetical protein